MFWVSMPPARVYHVYGVRGMHGGTQQNLIIYRINAVRGRSTESKQLVRLQVHIHTLTCANNHKRFYGLSAEEIGFDSFRLG